MPHPPTIHRIVTHPGGAHKDDFLACSVMLHLHQVAVFRRDPTEGDLEDPGTIVIDVGHEHAPEKGNFDHHQFPKDHPPICALSLVLQHLGVYEDARRFCEWLEPAEWFDSRGANDTAKWLNVEREVITQLNSPMDVTLLRRFALCEKLDPTEPLWQVMNMVGEDLLNYLKKLRSRLDFIGRHAKFWTLEPPGGESFEVLFLPRTNPLPEEPSSGLVRFVQEANRSKDVVAMVYPDRRGAGYGLGRYNDNRSIDFSGLADACDDVHFAHARGFVAKTTATETDRLRELLMMARQAAS